MSDHIISLDCNAICVNVNYLTHWRWSKNGKWRWMVNGMLYTSLKLQLNFDKRPIDRECGTLRIGMVCLHYGYFPSQCGVCRLPTAGENGEDEERMRQMWDCSLRLHQFVVVIARRSKRKKVSDVSNNNVFYSILGKARSVWNWDWATKKWDVL